MKQRWGYAAAVGTAAGITIAACSDDASNESVVGLDAGADARGTPRDDGGRPRPDPEPDLDASSGDDDDVEHPCTGKVVINELQPGGDGGAEFVELFNPTDCAIGIGDWKLLYRSAIDTAGVGSLHTFDPYAAIRARTFLLVANAKFAGTRDAELKGALGNEGGQVGLVDDTAKVVDAVGYGVNADGGVTQGQYTEGSPAKAPPAGSSLGRKKDGDDTDKNASDFVVFAKHSARVSNEE